MAENPEDIRQSIPRETLSGRNTGENIRHAIVRVAFMNCLLQDQRTMELFERWEQQTGLYAAAQQYATAMGRTAQESGFESLPAFVDAWQAGRLPATVKFDAPEHQQEGARLMHEVEVAEERFVRCHESVRATLRTEALAFIQGLGLSWSWIAADLLDAFVGGALALSLGRRAQVHVVLDSPNPPAPPVSLHFETRPGEMAREALQRLQRFQHEAAAAAATLGAALEPAVPQGYMPQQNTREILARYAVWFYEYRLCSQSIRALATKPWPTFQVTRQAILHGIREAERLLSLSRHSL
jgi:hypothetical protein